MSLERTIRMPKPTPTAAELRSLLKEYGIKRWQMAQAMQVREVTMRRYLLPPTSKHAMRIPQIRMDAMMIEIAKLDAKLEDSRPRQ